MSDLRPAGIKVKIGGKEHEMLFTIRAIETIQEKCNAALIDAIKSVVNVADGSTDIQDLSNFCTIIAALCQKEGTEYTAKDFDGTLKPMEYQMVAWKILQAYGFSVPDPDEEDGDLDEDDDPNQKTGR